jgi:hypothetical protein
MPFYLKDYKIAGRAYSFATLFWIVISTISIIAQVLKGIAHNNNYLIFINVFYHSLQKLNLFAAYPAVYGDTNHYGPFFSLIIAPFAAMPNKIGLFLWCIANSFFLLYAIKKLPISQTNKNIILLIGIVELLTSLHNVQFNPMATSFILFSYILVKNKNDFWATMFIAAGFFVKLYGIVGLAFFLFSDNKLKFVLSFAFWMLVFFALPMLISSPQFVIQSYVDWYHSLAEKNTVNLTSDMQGMTAMKVLQKVFHLNFVTNTMVIIGGFIVYVCTLLRYKYFQNVQFQLNYLASLLIAVVIFSSSAEAATFIFAMVGVGIWFINQKEKTTLVKALLIFAILCTSLSTTDLFPKFIKQEYIRPYALKALPCLFIWIFIAYQLLFKKYDALTS